MRLAAATVAALVAVCAAVPWEGTKVGTVVLDAGFVALALVAVCWAVRRPGWVWMAACLPAAYWGLADLFEAACRATACYDGARARMGTSPDWGQMVSALGLLELWVVGFVLRATYELGRLVRRLVSHRRPETSLK